MKNIEGGENISGERGLALTNSMQVYLAGIHQEDPDWIGHHGEELRTLFSEEPELFSRIEEAMDAIDKRMHH